MQADLYTFANGYAYSHGIAYSQSHTPAYFHTYADSFPIADSCSYFNRYTNPSAHGYSITLHILPAGVGPQQVRPLRKGPAGT